MRAWESIIELIRNGEAAEASRAYEQARPDLTITECKQIIWDWFKKLGKKIVRQK